MYRGGGSKYGSHRGHKRGRGNDRGHGRGRGRGRGGHPPGLSGREIGMWHKAKSMGRKAENERIQRQEVNMTQKHEKYLTEMVGELNNAPPSLGASALPNNPLIGSSSSDRSHFSWAHSSAKNDPDDTASNEWLKSDLMSREKHNEMYKQMAEFRRKLPAHSMKETIVNLVSANQVVVISGETGCGKTTQVTQFILDDAIKNNRGSSCRIVCTQPRRISAISIAERVAEERGESVGDGSTGYQIRLESKLPREKGSILYCTTGVLLRWLIDDPDFSRASHVIIDEIHERSIHSDFLLIVVKDILSRRPDLRVVLMSATLNAEMFSQYFNNCPMLNIPGFTFPVQQHFLEEIIPTIHYNPAPSSSKKRYWRGRVDRNAAKNHEELWQEYLSLLRSRFSPEAMIECLENMDFEKIDYCLVEQLLVHIGLNMKEGAVLVFLPGWQDISTVHDLLKKNPFFSKDKFRILPLHSLMPTVNQRQIFDRPPPGVRKIVLSTSLAETSITIEDVVFVVNCGKTKEKNFDVEKQLESLLPVWISKASCKQRMGRAGRVQAGFCFNLFTEFHYEQMADYQEPEILRTPLEEICLQVKTLKQGMTEPFLSKALQPPSHEAIEQAITTLRQLNAFDTDENLTPLGYHLARLPVHPRIGKIILFGAIMSCLDPVLTIASSMGFKDPYVIPLNKEKQADECRRRLSKDTQSDHLTLINAYKEWESAERYRNGHQFCWDNFLSPSVLQMIKNMKTQFAEHLCQIGFISFKNPKEEEANYNSQNQGLIKAVLCAGLYPNVIFVSHPPQMARRPPRLSIQNDGRQLKVAIHPKSVNAEETSFRSNWMIYREKIKSSKIFIHDCSTVTPYSLLFFGGEITMARDEEQEIVAVDEWIKFNCRETVTNLVKKLREELDKLLEEKIRHPGLTLSLNKNCTKDRQSILIRAIIDLVTTE